MEKSEKKTFSLSLPARASAFGIGSNIIIKALAVLFTSAFTRLLLPEEYGLYALFASWLGIFTVISTFSLAGSVLYRGMQKFRDDAAAFLSATLSLSLIFTFLSLVIYLFLKDKINSLTGLSTALSLLIFTEVASSSAINTYLAKCRYFYRYKTTLAISLFYSLAWQILAVVIIVATEYKSEARIIASVTVAALTAIPIIIYIFSQGKRFSSRKYWGFALKFNSALVPYHLAHTALTGSDKIIIERIAGQGALAKYSIGYSAGMLLTLAVNGVNSALQPWLFRKLSAGEAERARRLVYALTKLISLLSLLFILFAPEALSLLAPREYREALGVIYPIALSLLPSFVFSVLTSAKMHDEKNLSTLISTALAAALSIVLNLALIPRFGYIAAAPISLVSSTVCLALQYLFSKKSEAKKLIIVNNYLQLFLFFALCTILAAFIRDSIYARLASAIPVLLLIAIEGLSLFAEIREKA